MLLLCSTLVSIDYKRFSLGYIMNWFSDDIYDIKALTRYIVTLILFTGLSYVTKGYVFGILPFFCLSALIRRKHVDLMFWVMVLSFTGVSNPFLFPKTSITFIIQRLSLFVIAGILMLRVAGRKTALMVAPFAGIFIYITWEALISAQGFEPMVSYLKIILFIPIYLAFYGTANELTSSCKVNSREVRSVVIAIGMLIILGSFVLWPFPGISQLKAISTDDAAKIAEMVAQGDSLFMGIANHSQALGPVLSVLMTLMLGDIIFGIKRWAPLYIVTLVIGFFLIIKTSSRTSMGALLAGVAILFWLFNLARRIDSRWRSKVISSMFLLSIMMIITIFAVSSVRERVIGFALKRNAIGAYVGSEDLTFLNITSSRQGLVDAALENFKEKPFTGNGFQVSEKMKYEHRSTLLEYMSAPIEKGVWPTAVLEEGGFPGLIFFSGFLLYCFFTLVKLRAYIGAGTFFVFTITNLGEFTFFSMSYAGGFEWMLVFAAVILDGQRLKEETQFNYPWQYLY